MSEFLFEKAGTKINRGISMIIYADPGIGKTTLASTLTPGETLIINTEAGVGPLLGSDHLVFNLNIENLMDIERLYKYLRTEKHPFKNIVLDNISELEQLEILHLTRKRGKEFTEIREYGDSACKIREWLHLFRDLVEQDINVIFNAWEGQVELKKVDGVTLNRMFPKLMKSIAPEMCGLVDVVGHLEVHEKSGQRWIRIGPHEMYITKTQFKGLEGGEEANLPVLLEKLYAHDYTPHQQHVVSEAPE